MLARMTCLACGRAAPELGALCRSCALEVAPCDGLIADHVRSTVTSVAAQALLIDGFGTAHPAAERMVIGRSQEGQLVVLAASVSREHAELRRTDGGWQLRDLGSRNGTFVDGARAQGRVTLGRRAIVRVGDVALWFLAEVPIEPHGAVSIPTAGAAAGLVRYLLGDGLCLVGGSDLATGGALLRRATPEEPWVERALAPLEFQLLRALCVRALEETDSPAAVRGCVATRQLAKALPFQSRYANEENVRQVVRRLRAVLGEWEGVEAILAVAPGRGYYLACAVARG
jgi:hypothetical protein